MSATQVKKFLLIGSVVGLSAITVAACCSSKKESDGADAAPSASVAPSANAEPTASAPAEDVPVWKQKCGDADRPESGTVTALKTFTVYKDHDINSEKLTTIGRGTWVDLLGAHGTWLCVDYPCGVGKLCPGWVESRYSERKTVIVDAGVDAKAVDSGAAVVDAGVVDSGKLTVIDAGKTPTPVSTNPKLPPGSRPTITVKPK